MKTTDINASNALIYKASKTIGKEIIYVTIRLDDECKNGHQDFSITADLYTAGKPKTDRNFISGGCIHDEVIKFFPKFKQFVNLHLADYTGAPMCAGANGYYHLNNGFRDTKITDSNFKDEYCEYYNLTPNMFEAVKNANSQTHFIILLLKCKAFEHWKNLADKAIQTLEELTGTKFIVDSPKLRFAEESLKQQIAEEQTKIDNGYYTPEAKQARADKKTAQERQQLIDKATESIDKINEELHIKLALFDVAGSEVLKSVIYYGFRKTLCFNWNKSSYNKEYTQAEADELIKKSGLQIAYEVK